MGNPLYEKEPTRGADAGEFWQARFDRALRYRQRHWNGDKAWKRYLNLYRGRHWSSYNAEQDNLASDIAREKITVNITGSSVLNMLPFLIKRRPKFTVNPTRPQYDVSAKLQDLVLNYSWKEYDMQKQARAAALDGIIFGQGILKTGFTLEVDESYKIPAHGRIEYRDYVKKQAPWVRRVSPFNFVFDPEAPERNLETARWCAEIMFLPLQDIIENERYSKRAIKAINNGEYEPTQISSLLQFGELDNQMPWLQNDEDQYGDLARIVCFEIWDKRSGKYFFFAHGVHTPLIEKDEWPYDYLEGFPYERYDFIPVPEEPYPLGLPAFIEDQQYELNRIRTAMFQHRRRFNRKYTAIETEVRESELEKLINGDDGTVVLVDSHESIQPIQDANMSSDEYNIEGTIKEDIRELIGSDELARGGSLPSRTTATEVQARTKLYGLKLEDRVEQFDRFIEATGRKVLQHIKANWVTDDVVRVTGPAGHFWQEFTPEDIQGEFDLEVESTSSEPIDEVTERQQAIQIMQILTGSLEILQAFQVPVNWVELFKWVFSKFEGLKDVQRFFPAAGSVDAPINMEMGGAGGSPGGFNVGASPAASPTPAAPPNPMAQQAQPQAAEGQVLGGLMGALGG
jgi:hypothetical protein